MTNIPVSLQVLATLDKARRASRVLSGFGRFLPETSFIGRVATHADEVVLACILAAEELVTAQTSSWGTLRSKFVFDTVSRFGTLVLACTDYTRGRMNVWAFGGHVFKGHESYTFGLSCPSSLKDVVMACVDAVTEDLGTRRLHLGPDGMRADATFGEYKTPETIALIEDLRAELATGETCRSLLLVGPPGSGKSSAARQIAEAFGETVLALDGTWIQSLINAELAETLNVSQIATSCGADVIIVDDYDRRMDEGSSLVLLSEFRRAARVVIFTANSRGVFSGAECRPQRFDKIVRIDSLDPVTAKNIAPDLPESIAEEAYSKLLASYLQELAVLCRAGRADPRQALDDLILRQELAQDNPPLPHK